MNAQRRNTNSETFSLSLSPSDSLSHTSWCSSCAGWRRCRASWSTRRWAERNGRCRGERGADTSGIWARPASRRAGRTGRGGARRGADSPRWPWWSSRRTSSSGWGSSERDSSSRRPPASAAVRAAQSTPSTRTSRGAAASRPSSCCPASSRQSPVCTILQPNTKRYSNAIQFHLNYHHTHNKKDILPTRRNVLICRRLTTMEVLLDQTECATVRQRLQTSSC